MTKRAAFTLIELLISMALMSLVLLGLYGALKMQKSSNKHLYGYLIKALDTDKAIAVLYKDILYSDGNLTIKNGERDILCLNNTTNSLYGLSRSKVCWLVAKEGNRLLRVEGNDYSLPLKYDDRVAVDTAANNVVLFDVVRKKGDILVAMQEANHKPFVFLLQGIEPPPKPPKKNKPKNPQTNDHNNTSNPPHRRGRRGHDLGRRGRGDLPPERRRNHE